MYTTSNTPTLDNYTPRAPFWHPDGWSDIGPEEQIARYIAIGPMYQWAERPRAAPVGTEVVEIQQDAEDGHGRISHECAFGMVERRPWNNEMRSTVIVARVRVVDSATWAEAFNKAVEVWFALRQPEEPEVSLVTSNILIPGKRAGFKLKPGPTP